MKYGGWVKIVMQLVQFRLSHKPGGGRGGGGADLNGGDICLIDNFTVMLKCNQDSVLNKISQLIMTVKDPCPCCVCQKFIVYLHN